MLPLTDESVDLGVSVGASATIDDPGSNDIKDRTIDWVMAPPYRVGLVRNVRRQL